MNSLRATGLLNGPSGSTTEAASYADRQADLSAKHCFAELFGNFWKDFFFDPAIRFLLNFLAVSETMGLFGRALAPLKITSALAPLKEQLL